MKIVNVKFVLSMCVVLAAAGTLLAAPGLPVTRPPLLPASPTWTGPTIDPHATQGQWFKNSTTAVEESRPYEFHDNVTDYGGGGSSFLAIQGYTQNVVLTAGKITSFNILATVTNDMPALTPWLEGTNSHGEFSTNREQYVGDMLATKLVMEFAISGLNNLPNGFSDPYRQGYLPYIIATNEDQLAWYCYTPGSEPQGQSTAIGDYYVPTWDFGDIPLGDYATKLLSFTVDGAGIDSEDPRYSVIMGSADVLSNRTTSLKISNWIDNLTQDIGTPYPTDPFIGSDCSVFFVPEPSSVLLLISGLVVLGLAWLRRRSG